MVESWSVFFALLLVSGSCQAASVYPTAPDPQLTPGSICERADQRRYPERIAYCERNVDREEKKRVIQAYNQRGYRIEGGDRHLFKIDHLIPLCAGGANHESNLWPQHMSVYRITDPLEAAACEKMALGRLRQSRAIELLLRAKQHLDEAPAILAELKKME